MVGTFESEKTVHSLLVGQVKLRMYARDDIVVALGAQFAKYRRTDHACMAGYLYL